MSATLRVEDFTENRRLFREIPPVIKVQYRIACVRLPHSTSVSRFLIFAVSLAKPGNIFREKIGRNFSFDQNYLFDNKPNFSDSITLTLYVLQIIKIPVA
jgi:hypothetical protein